MEYTAETIGALELAIRGSDGERTVSIRLGKRLRKNECLWCCQVEILGPKPSFFELSSVT